ncbi:MAG: hypothetical protein ACREF4_05045 [Gammaproteobacteria bacterium]
MPIWRRQALPPSLTRHLKTQTPRNPSLRRWALEADPLALHTNVLARLETDWLAQFGAQIIVASGPRPTATAPASPVHGLGDPRGPTRARSSILLRIRREIGPLLGQGLGWDSPRESGAISIDTGARLAERLTIDPPFKENTVHRLDVRSRAMLHGWLERVFVDAWTAWCLDQAPRPLQPDLLDRYARVHALLDAIAAAQPDRPLRDLLRTQGAAQRLRGEGVQLPRLALAARWPRTAGDFAVVIVGAERRLNTREMKEQHGAADLEQHLARVWQEYTRWLAAHPTAVSELADRLGLPIG